jgi:hypothetical protein
VRDPYTSVLDLTKSCRSLSFAEAPAASWKLP